MEPVQEVCEERERRKHHTITVFEKREHHPLKQTGDQEKITLHEHEKFRAVAPDDNSQEELRHPK